MEPIFIDLPASQAQFDKTADTRLPADTSQWEHAIFSALNEQHPDLPMEDYRLVFNSQDDDRNAVGNIVIKEGFQIPVIVDQGNLKPFDMFLKDGELHTLNRENVMEATMGHRFGEPIPPGSGEIADVFLTHSRPPYDGKYTFAALGATQEKYAEVLAKYAGEHVLDLVRSDDTLKEILKEAGRAPYTPEIPTTKTASLVKSAAVPLKQSRMTDALVKSGSYRVVAENGKRYRGWYFDNPVDPAITAKSGMFIPFSKHAVDVRHFVGDNEKVVFHGLEENFGKLPSDEIKGHGIFHWETKEGEVRATVPMEIVGRNKTGYIAKSAGYIAKEVRLTKDTGLNDALVDGNTIYLPKSAAFMGVNKKTMKVKEAKEKSFFDGTPFMSVFKTSDDRYRIELDPSIKRACYPDMPDSFSKKQAASFLGEMYEPESVETVLNSIRARGSVFLRAPQVQKTASDNLSGVLKKAAEMTPRIRKHAETILESYMKLKDAPDSSILRKVGKKLDLAKVADYEMDSVDQGLDTTLGLNILTEENILKYFDYIDLLDSAKQVCLKMLLAARLGLPIDEGAARSAAFSLDAVISDLHRLQTLYSSAGGVE